MKIRPRSVQTAVDLANAISNLADPDHVTSYSLIPCVIRHLFGLRNTHKWLVVISSDPFSLCFEFAITSQIVILKISSNG